LAFAALLIPATAFLRSDEIGGINWFSDGRRRWKRAYLRTHDEHQATREAGFLVYPGSVGDRLKYLEDHHLNLFVP